MDFHLDGGFLKDCVALATVFFYHCGASFLIEVVERLVNIIFFSPRLTSLQLFSTRILIVNI